MNTNISRMSPTKFIFLNQDIACIIYFITSTLSLGLKQQNSGQVKQGKGIYWKDAMKPDNQLPGEQR